MTNVSLAIKTVKLNIFSGKVLLQKYIGEENSISANIDFQGI